MPKSTALDLHKPVKKHVSLIHITNELSLLQRKAFNIFLLNAYDRLLVPGTHTVDLDLFCSAVGFDSKNYPYLKESLLELKRKETEGDLLNEAGDVKGWRAMSLLSLVELDYDTRTITYEIPSKLAESLYNPNIFSYLSLSIQGSFSSKYALALYENCVRFRGVGTTGFIELAIWRKLLGATGSSYDDFKIFNNRILKPAVAEVNDISDVHITDILFKREGRRISHIKFKFTSDAPKNAISSIANREALMQTNRFKLLMDKGMEKPWALYASEKYDGAYIQAKVAQADKAQADGRIKTTYQRFLYSAIMGDYQDTASSQAQTQAKAQQAQQAKHQAAKAQAQQADRAAEQQRAQTLKNKRENTLRFEVYRQSQPETVIESIDNTAFQTKKGQLTVPRGHQSPSKAAVTQFLKEYYAEHVLADYVFTEAQEAEIQRRLNNA